MRGGVCVGVIYGTRARRRRRVGVGVGVLAYPAWGRLPPACRLPDPSRSLLPLRVKGAHADAHGLKAHRDTGQPGKGIALPFLGLRGCTTPAGGAERNRGRGLPAIAGHLPHHLPAIAGHLPDGRRFPPRG